MDRLCASQLSLILGVSGGNDQEDIFTRCKLLHDRTITSRPLSLLPLHRSRLYLRGHTRASSGKLRHVAELMLSNYASSMVAPSGRIVPLDTSRCRPHVMPVYEDSDNRRSPERKRVPTVEPPHNTEH